MMSAAPLQHHDLNAPIRQFVRTDYVRVHENLTIHEALSEVRNGRTGGRIVYFYVLGSDEQLRGVFPTRRLLLSQPNTPIRDVMIRSVITLSELATVLQACELFMRHRLLALPVVSADGRMRGIVDVELYTEELGDLHRHTEAEDVFQLIGVRLSQIQTAGVAKAFSVRFPRLLCNVGGGLACAAVSGLYTGLLAEVVALSFFVPVVLALAESVSIQSLTLALQAQHGPGLTLAEAIRRLLRELPLGVFLGLGCGLLVAAAALPWQGKWIALCLMASITISVTAAAFFGMLMPILLRTFRFDPKVASGPVTLAATDTVTLAVYLSMGTWLFV